MARVKNDGTKTRDITVASEVNGDDGFTTKFFKGSKNVTAKIQDTGVKFRAVAAGASTRTITIRIKADNIPDGEGMDMFLGGRLGNKPLPSTDFVNVDIDSET